MHWVAPFVLVLGLLVSAASHATETVTIAADQWCPYNCEPNSDKPGLMIEIAQKAFAKHNIAIEYHVMPWTRAIEQVRAHKYTAIVGATKRDAPDFVYPSIPQAWTHNSFYTKTNSTWKFTGVDSLPAISLGVIANYSYNEELDGYIEKNRNNRRFVQSLSSDNGLEINIKKMLADRIGAVIEGDYVMAYTLAKNGWSDKVKNVGSLSPSEADDLFIAFSPKEPKAKKYAQILSQEIKAMRASGELKKILDTYHIQDWQKRLS